MSDIPSNVTSEDLSEIFSIHVADILFQPAHPSSEHLASNDQSTGEAWIKHLSDRRAMEDFVQKYSRSTIGDWKMSLNIVEEPISLIDLCIAFEKGSCEFSTDRCDFRHIMCDESDQCDDRTCWFGHHRRRPTTSIRRPIESKSIHSLSIFSIRVLFDVQLDTDKINYYRARISNVPSNVTREELIRRLNIPSRFSDLIKYSNQPSLNRLMVWPNSSHQQ